VPRRYRMLGAALATVPALRGMQTFQRYAFGGV
jgi:hypothetical protein